MFGIFAGYKTYIVGLTTIISAIGGCLAGIVPINDAVQLTVTALLGMTVRNGISNGK